MHTKQRLNAAYKNARRKYFDENSKYVFFSDCHRGDDSISDEFSRNQTLMLAALQYYYKGGYTYVEAGDGDELWEYENFKYIRTAHSDIFTLLKEFFNENRFIMLYGNHNIVLKNKRFVRNNYYYFYNEYTGKYERLFYGMKPIESLVLKEKKSGQEILVVHGHQGDLYNDQLWILSLIAVRYFWKFVHLVGFHNPASPARNQFTSHKIERAYRKWLRNRDLLLICGHTHRMRYPKKGEQPYFNIGCCLHTKGITAIELSNNQISLVQWRIISGENGELRVSKKVINGPENIKKWKKNRD